MIIVSNTSPITNLGKVGQLNLMQQLYENILILTAVYEELKSKGGRDEHKNLQLLHRHCHEKKTANDGSLRGTNDKAQVPIGAG